MVTWAAALVTCFAVGAALQMFASLIRRGRT